MKAAPRDTRLIRLVTGFALLVALLLAVGMPAVQFSSAVLRETARGEAHGEAAALAVGEIVARNPDMWLFEEARIVAALGRVQAGDGTISQRVLDLAGATLGEQVQPLASPLLRLRTPVLDGERLVAEIETERSLRPALFETAVVAAIAIVLALLAFTALRLLPLRALNAAVQRAAHLAQFDTLTGLPNRALFHQRLREAAAAARRDGTAVAVICIDLDHFKDINDTLGHAAGDRLLVEATERLRSQVRETDTLARLGGDEFAVVQVGLRQPERAEALARRLIAVLAQPFDLDGHRAVVGASIGIAPDHAPDGDLTRLLREADLALYQAKAQGRGTYCFFEAAMNERLQERKRLEHDLEEALQTNAFRLHYQPIVEMPPGQSTGVVVGAEALIRWRHPTRGDVGPTQFIPVAESNGMIVPIGRWALHEACRRAAAWPRDLRVAVNVSPVQFRHPGFVKSVADALEQSGLTPRRLELEVTEGVLLNETEETLATLESLRALGVRLAMDDFGTGYSSLGYLRKFRFDKIKIDASFVRNLGEDEDSDAIVRAVLGMGQAMGVRVNAEGVESDLQRSLLQLEGCGEMQGYLFGRPVPPEEFEAAVAKPEVVRAA